MMRGFFVREAHDFVAMLVNHVVMVLGLTVLGLMVQDLAILLAVDEATGQQHERCGTQHNGSPIVAFL
jgi:hypothetical protein